MSAHAPECEKADPGSLCDCDCAGARHAVRRTVGNVPGAGQVSKRAQRAAARDGRASVVNNRAEPDDAGKHRKTGRHREDVNDPPVKIPAPEPEPRQPTPAFSKRTAAKLKKAARGLPKDDAGWKADALHVNQQQVDLLRSIVDFRTQRRDETAAEAEQVIDRYAREVVVPELLAEKRPGYKRYKKGDPDLFDDARLIAPARLYDPAGAAYLAENQQLRGDSSDHDRFRRDAEAALNRELAGTYPTDQATGYRMPSPKLQGHLKAVRDAGAAALKEAKKAWETNPPPEVVKAHADLVRHDQIADAVYALRVREKRVAEGARFSVPLPDGLVVIKSPEQYRALVKQYKDEQAALGGLDGRRAAKQTVAKHEANTLRAMMGAHRDFGNVTHATVTAERDTELEKRDTDRKYGITDPRRDWRERLAVAEKFFPDDWVKKSSASPLKVGASDRAYYGGTKELNLLSMPSHANDATELNGALSEIDEVNVHELGHRMEKTIPGLTHLEFAYVRERGHNPDGTVDPARHIFGYDDKTEVSQHDNWANPYVGKTYEIDKGQPSDKPGERFWEVFQTGLQDTFGRGGNRFGPRDDPDQLQAFVVGAMLLLG